MMICMFIRPLIIHDAKAIIISFVVDAFVSWTALHIYDLNNVRVYCLDNYNHKLLLHTGSLSN